MRLKRHQNSQSLHANEWPKLVSIQFKLINCKNSTQDAPKFAAFSAKIKFYPPLWGGGQTLPTSHPLGAFGVSILALLDSTRAFGA